MRIDDPVMKQLGPAAQLISAEDLAWLAAEAVRIEGVIQTLVDVDKRPLDFAAMPVTSNDP